MLKFTILTTVLCFAFAGSKAFAEARELSGFVSLEAGTYYFIPSADSGKFPLRATTPEALSSLKKLKAKDYIYGTGEMTAQREYLVYSIEFVGLRALLGNWKAQQGAIFSFVDFKHAQVLSAGGDHIMLLNYAVSPSEESGWKVFFSNENDVSLGNLSLSGRNAFIEFFDGETGLPTHKVIMNKLDR